MEVPKQILRVGVMDSLVVSLLELVPEVVETVLGLRFPSPLHRMDYYWLEKLLQWFGCCDLLCFEAETNFQP